MERRYLVAAIALIGTFAITSRGFRALERVSLVHSAHAQTLATQQCPSSIAARALAKIHTICVREFLKRRSCWPR